MFYALPRRDGAGIFFDGKSCTSKLLCLSLQRETIKHQETMKKVLLSMPFAVAVALAKSSSIVKCMVTCVDIFFLFLT